MFDAAYFHELSEGKERIQYLKKCIDEADREQDCKLALELRYLHIKESTFNEDNLDSLIVFPEYMALFDKHPDLHDKYTFMFAFKWIIESIMNFPQVSIEMAESYFEEFKKRCEMYGYTLKIYYMKQINFFEKIDPERTMRLLELFRQEDSDNISDGIADDMSLEICTELDYGSEEKALELLSELRNKGIRSGEVPQITYGKCVEHFTKKGNFKEAEYYADLLTPMTRGTGTYYMMEMSNVMILKTFTDPTAALKIFHRFMEHFIPSKNVKFRFYFANASYRLFKTLKEHGSDKENLRLPHTFELYNSSGEYDTAELSGYFKKIAEEEAAKFDKRNKNTMYSDMITFEYPDAPVKEYKLPAHGTAERVPEVIAVPIITAPSNDDIIKAVEALPDCVIREVSPDEEKNRIAITVYNEKTSVETEYRIVCHSFEEDPINPWNLTPFHKFEEGVLEKAAEKFPMNIVIAAFSERNTELVDFNFMLKIAAALNKDNSPAIMNMCAYQLLSADWVSLQAETQIPPYPSYMYNVIPEPDKKGRTFDIVTTGLRQFGSKEIVVSGVKHKNVELAYSIVRSIAQNVSSGEALPDEGEKRQLHAVYNNETDVFYSWTASENDDFIVPAIHLGYNAKAMEANDISPRIANKLSFRAPGRFYAIDNALCHERFPLAVDIFKKGGCDSFFAGFGFNTGNDDDDYVQIYAEIKNPETLEAVILDGENHIEGLQNGRTITVDPENVYFWRFDKDGVTYTADSIYLIKGKE
ncbi:MAG: hypothetical protein IJZ72_08965 [Oscillospiraceae bacterium]|nr:hypothetical protein [Oscillospiraceae bacterium]